MLNRNRVPLWLVVAIMALLLAAVVATIEVIQKPRASQMGELARACRSNSGTWLESYRECEYVEATWCTTNGGRFDECGSACRHSPDPAAPCTMQCIPLCIFSADQTDPDGKGKLSK